MKKYLLMVSAVMMALFVTADPLDTLSTVFTAPAWELSGPDADGRYTATLKQDLADTMTIYDDLGKVCIDLDVFSITGKAGNVGVSLATSTAHKLGKSDLRFVGKEEACIVGGAGKAIAGLNSYGSKTVESLEIGVKVVGGTSTSSNDGGVGIKGPTSASYAFRLSILADGIVIGGDSTGSGTAGAGVSGSYSSLSNAGLIGSSCMTVGIRSRHNLI